LDYGTIKRVQTEDVSISSMTINGAPLNSFLEVSLYKCSIWTFQWFIKAFMF